MGQSDWEKLRAMDLPKLDDAVTVEYAAPPVSPERLERIRKAALRAPKPVAIFGRRTRAR